MGWFNTQSWLLSSRVRSVLLEHYLSQRLSCLGFGSLNSCKQRRLRHSQPADALMNAVLPLRHLSVASALQVKLLPWPQARRGAGAYCDMVTLLFPIESPTKGDGLFLKEKRHFETTTILLFVECRVTMWPPCKYRIYDLACIWSASAQRGHLNSLWQAQWLLNIMILKLHSYIFFLNVKTVSYRKRRGK